MAKLSDHQSNKFTKLLMIGDSGTGKTGALTSLVKAGYKLKILDLDNGLDSLKGFVLRECPDKIDAVDFETRRDLYKSTNSGPIVSGVPKAFTESLSLMTKWSDGSSPSEWGEGTVFVLDSLTTLGAAALAWAESMNPSAKDKRNWYFQAQEALSKIISMLTSESFHANVIVISHVQFKELEDGTVKGYATAIGSALGNVLPKYFNTLILTQSQGSGKSVQRKIVTVPTTTIDLKNPVPFKLDQYLPLETGLATLFEKLKELK